MKLDPVDGAQRGFLQSANRNGVSPSRCAVVRRAGISAIDADEYRGGNRGVTGAAHQAAWPNRRIELLKAEVGRTDR
jgi:hypothetical protein